MHPITGCIRPTQTAWLPVLANIAPPPLRRKAAYDNLLRIAQNHPNWPLHDDIVDHPPKRLASRHPIWVDMSLVDIKAKLEEDWLSASVVNQHIVYVTLLSSSLALTCHAHSGLC